MNSSIKSNNLYTIFVCLFATLLVLTNIIAIKICQAPFYDSISDVLFFLPVDDNGFALPAGILTYPLTFLVSDIISEIWGEKKANFMVFAGFLMSIIMLMIIQISISLPPHLYWVIENNSFGYVGVDEFSNAYNSVFSLNGKLLFGSMLAYMVAQFVDIRIYHYLKEKTKERHLWLRNNGSTIISQLIDTMIVNSILFYWGFGWDFWLGAQVMLVVYVYKLIIALLDTPLIYLGVAGVNRYLKKGVA